MVSSIYGRLTAASYDHDDQRHELIAFYLAHWRRAGSPAPVLEPMCGTGFFLLPFLQAGAEIDGVDASAHMLAVCRQKCRAHGLNPALYHQALEDLALPRQYGFALIPDRSFAMIYQLDRAERCLRNLWDHLLPGGALVLDVKPSAGPDEFGAPGQTEHDIDDWPDGSTIVTTSMWAAREHGRVLRNVTKVERFVAGALVETELLDYNERWYSQPEIAGLLHASGFTDLEVTRAYDEQLPTADESFVVSCRKPSDG